MTKQRKIMQAVDVAYQRYVHVTAELIARQLEEEANGAPRDIPFSDEVDRLRRRAGAYRVQWEAAERRAEEAQDREDAR